MEIETKQTTSYTAHFTEEDVDRLFADPSEVLKLWPGREVHASAVAQRFQSTRSHKPREKVIKHDKNDRTTGKKTINVACQGCGKKFDARGLGQHQRGCAHYQLKKAAQSAG